MANVGPNSWYVNSVAYTAVPAWTAGATKAAGALIRPVTFTALSERVYVATTGGTTNASTEPVWTYTKGAIQPTDGSVVWQECTGQPGVNGDISAACPTWLQNKNTAVTVGLIIYDSVTSSLQIVSVAGTTGNGSQPSFSATAGTTTAADGTVTWKSLGPASNFGAWAAPHARLSNAATTNWAAINNFIWVSDNHAETQGATMTITFPGTAPQPNFVYCIDRTVALPAGTGNLKTTGSVTTTGNFAMNIGGGAFIYGLNFYCGTGASAAAILSFNPANSAVRCINCSFNQVSTASPRIALSGQWMEWTNCTVSFATAASTMLVSGGVLRWKNTPTSAVSGNVPSPLFTGQSGNGIIDVEGVDLSFVTTALVNGPGHFSFTGCRIASGVTPVSGNNATWVPVDFVNCDSAGTGYTHIRNSQPGQLTGQINVYRSSSAQPYNGVVNLGWLIATTANNTWSSPFESFYLTRWNTVIGANRTVTVYGLYNGASVPLNDQAWLEVQYLGSASSPLYSFANNTKANILATGTALTADTTSVWNAPAWAASTVYAVGNVVSGGGGNSVFICTTGGTSGSSLPSGFTGAADGASNIADGATVKWRCMFRFSTAVTLSSPQPQIVGDISVAIKVGVASSTFYFDPYVNLS